MIDLPNILRDRWRGRFHTGRVGYPGTAVPTIRAFVRRGSLLRKYAAWDGPDVNATIAGSPSATPWQAFWTPHTPYMEIPNILSCELNQGFDQDGQNIATLTVENIVGQEISAHGSIFRKFRRGWMSPFRGHKGSARPQSFDPLTGERLEKNAWWEVFDSSSQVTIWMGYGDDQYGMVKVFTGLIDSGDISTHPDRIVATIRDFGQALADQYFFGWVKDRKLRDPITFADRRKTDTLIRVGDAARASSTEPGHDASYVLDKYDSTRWLSRARTTPNNTEWVEIQVPQGRYEDFFLTPEYEGMEMFVSFYAAPLKATAKSDPTTGGTYMSDTRPTVDGVRVNPGWVNTGIGIVPEIVGDAPDGGKPYIAHRASLSRTGRYYRLNHRIFAGDGSKIRVHFRKLHRSGITDDRYPGQRIYRAGVRSLYSWRRVQKVIAKKQDWILVDDLSDVVKVVLQWAGFKDWEIEDTGITLSSPLIVNRQNKMMEVVKKMCELTGYIFFMGAPEQGTRIIGDNADLHIGTPVFRSTNLDGPYDDFEEVKDSDLLTGIKVHFTDEPKSSTIRVRGKVASKKDGGVTLGGGQVPGSESDRRIMATYIPPWAKRYSVGGIIKHVIHIDNQLRTEYECKIACLLIARAQALAAVTAVVEMPAWFGFELDDCLAVTDVATSVNTRLYIAQKTISFQAGRTAKLTQTLSGAVLDTPDMETLFADYIAAKYQEAADEAAFAAKQRQKPPPKPRKSRKK